jgi:hypothetical protein
MSTLQCRSVVVTTMLLCVPLVSQASPADLGTPDFHACAPAPQFLQIVAALAPREGGRHVSALRRLSSLPISIEGSAGTYRVQLGSAAPVTIVAPVDKRACQAISPNATRLMDGANVPGTDVAALAAALVYRESNSWPYGAAHTDDPRTQITVRTRNGRAIVTLVDYKTLLTPHLDCSSQEYYRVDLQTFAVKPFDGCGAGTPANRILPTLKDLPD